LLFGGLGNNIIQLAQAEYLSKKFCFIVHTPPHNFLNVKLKYLIHDFKPNILRQKPYFPRQQSAIFLELQKQANQFIYWKLVLFRSFFFSYDVLPFLPNLEDYRSVLRQELLPIIPHRADDLISEETLVIHIRSGDIFGSMVHEAYIQPPFSFYLKIINKFNFKDIVVITQDDLSNPCIDLLKKAIPELRIQTSDDMTDAGTILSARNLIIAHSSFSLCLGLASTKLKHIFIPQFDITKGFYSNKSLFWPNIWRKTFLRGTSISHFQNLDCDVHLVEIVDYLPIGDWQNTEQQHNLMREHPCEKILFK
jgi:hypothetical protein